ncbi:MAG: NAD(P)-dependent oxidoreductase [Oscillospiraceae bacterium]|nr:NAD(P)-dependent oxidoreductase [Oscillospiraceae bacterium]
MNILIIGGTCSLTNQIIRKMKKEGHRVYLLTGDRFKVTTYEKVFERYDLPYDSECISDVFESVNPDVTIFMGAFDSNFRWENEQREIVRYTSSLTNFLTAHAMASSCRFIYLSSDEVYGNNNRKNITEDILAAPSTMKGMALAQGEDICANFQRIRKADIVVLRLDHFYKVPTELKEADDVVSTMCLEAMKTQNITVNKDNKFSLLFESDAVEFIFRVVTYSDHVYPLYNLSSSKELNDMDIAQYIKQKMDNDDVVINIVEAESEKRRCVLDNGRFNDEFVVNVFADTEKTVERVVEYMTSHPRIFLTEEERKKSLFERLLSRASWAVRALIPYIENLICFIPFFFLNIGAANSQFFSELDFYLLYVLLFAVIHGQQQALFSAVLAVFGYFITEAQGRGLLEISMDYNIYIWIAQLFIIGLVVGYMKDQIHKLRLESEEEQQFLNRQLSDIKDINGSNVRVKDALETQIVNSNDSIGKIYAITSKLENNTPEEVLFYAAEMLKEFIGSEDVAIYTVSNKDYARLFSHTSDKAKSLGKSIRYRELEDLYNTISEHKVYINKRQDERYPLMSAAIFDDDEMQIIIMAWGIPWERMTLGQANVLTSVSYLIQNAVLRAARYITMLENRRYQEDKHMVEQESFTSLVHVFTEARDKELTECSIVQLHLDPSIGQDKYESVAKVLAAKLRDSDFIGTLDDGKMYILLSNADSNDASYVMDRVKNEGYDCVLLEDFRL